MSAACKWKAKGYRDTTENAKTVEHNELNKELVKKTTHFTQLQIYLLGLQQRTNTTQILEGRRLALRRVSSSRWALQTQGVIFSLSPEQEWGYEVFEQVFNLYICVRGRVDTRRTLGDLAPPLTIPFVSVTLNKRRSFEKYL